MPGDGWDFFISYARIDLPWAEWIAAELNRAGYSTRMQARDFRPGSDFVFEIDQAIMRSDRVIAVLSPAYLQSKWTGAEWRAALAQDPTGERRFLLPVRIKRCQAGGLLAGRVYEDLVDLDESEARRSLLSAAGPATRRPSPTDDGPTPAFPGTGSPYLHEVREIAPDLLLGRDAELRAMAEFCAADGGGAYLWWRAEAWSGKSAVMAWFTLHPPAGVRVVSFFLTGRYPGRDDRTAFAEGTGQQLSRLLDEGPPMDDADLSRYDNYLQLLTAAGEACRRRGERLVLVVDGLDEDRGVSSSMDGFSVAALLPRNPPAGIRILVSSRPHPELPGDLRYDHPLRSPGAARPLAPSAHAAAVHQVTEHDLNTLLRGGPVARDTLGLITAAGGGLGVADLSELTGHDVWAIEGMLGGASGRTFARRPGQLPGGDDVYLLAHETLQAQAEHWLKRQLSEHRQQLHHWADRYAGWPADTPAYLLVSYPRMLRRTKNAERLMALATSPSRRHRLWLISGGDAAALQDIELAQQTYADITDPDLGALAFLAMRREQILGANTRIPTALPAVWARLGEYDRAEALLPAMASAVRFMHGIEQLADVLLENNLAERAVRVLTEARRRAPDAFGTMRKARLLVAYACAGLVEKAVPAAGALTAAHHHLPSMLAKLGRTDVIGDLLSTIPPERHRGVRDQLLSYLAAADPQAAADRLAQEPGREQTPEVWKRTVLGLFRVGAPERAEAILDAVHPAWIADGLRANAVECLTEHGRQDVARRLAAAVPVHSVEARAACAAALGDVATVLRLVDAEADPARRLHLLSRVIRPGRRANQVLVPTATHLAEQSQDSAPANVNELAESLLESDLPELAGQLLGGLPTDKINILLLFRAIRAAHAVGRHAQAVTLARLALEVAEPLLFTDKAHNLFVLTLLGAGDRDEAAAHVEAHPRIHWDDKIVAALDKAPRPARPDRAADDDRRGQTAEAQALVVRAQDCLATGDRAQARKYAEAAQATAAAANPFLAARQRQAICQALLAAGKTAEARAVADAIDHRAAGTLRLACRIAVAKSSAQPAELIDLVRQSEDVLEAAVADPAWTATAGPVETLNDVEEALATAVRALVDLGHAGAASRLCRSHPNDWLRYHMVKALVAALQENGHRDHATAWAALLVPADRTAALSAPADGRRDQPDATPASLDHLRSLAHEATSKMPRPPTLPGGFAGLAAECAEAGLIPEAHALMVQALLASAWRAALPVMASHFPEALVRLAQLSEE